MNKAFEDSTIEIRCILHRQRMADGFSTPKLPFKFMVKRSMAGFYPVYNYRKNDVNDIQIKALVHQELEGQFWC